MPLAIAKPSTISAAALARPGHPIRTLTSRWDGDEEFRKAGIETIEAIRLPAEWTFVNSAPPPLAALQALPAVNAITVNTVHGNERSIAAVMERFRPEVESMEGAAFMSACLISNVTFAQVRAVSNIVERRNRSAWRVAEALERLAETTRRILAET
jgi:nucleoside phosphorylase